MIDGLMPFALISSLPFAIFRHFPFTNLSE
jgi:hypothetical protein